MLFAKGLLVNGERPAVLLQRPRVLPLLMECQADVVQALSHPLIFPAEIFNNFSHLQMTASARVP